MKMSKVHAKWMGRTQQLQNVARFEKMDSILGRDW